ncbi:unnamed protein product [Notodromas monacha]|uniref:FAM69 protein-kinase domain-containing protein n=1 Tax=Notodromas monacha TaxID=399045 RepID=A0A7R9GEF4_9CRUS|nr:unnamed protein product [Notodromas monacha]CAG0918004.1 unnamed protein product [Notodromas monacha]
MRKWCPSVRFGLISAWGSFAVVGLSLFLGSKWFKLSTCEVDLVKFKEFGKEIFASQCGSLTGVPSEAQLLLYHICSDENLEKRVSCFENHHGASKIVLKYECFLNSSKNCAVHPSVPAPYVIKSEREPQPMTPTFDLEEICEILQLNYGVDICRDSGDVDLPQNSVDKLNALKSMETLAEVFWGFSLPAFFPRVLSVHDNWYVVEFLPTIEPGKSNDKVSLTKNLLSFLSNLEVRSEQRFGNSLVLCDWKLEHFGTNGKGEFKILDADAVFLLEQMPKIIFPEGEGCSTDEDCSFFDCREIYGCEHGRCVLKETTSKRNYNAGMFCEKVVKMVDNFFLVWLEKFMFGGIPPRITGGGDTPSEEISQSSSAIHELLSAEVDESNKDGGAAVVQRCSQRIRQSKGQKRRRFSESTTSESDDGYDKEESPPAASKRGKQNKVHANNENAFQKDAAGLNMLEPMSILALVDEKNFITNQVVPFLLGLEASGAVLSEELRKQLEGLKSTLNDHTLSAPYEADVFKYTPENKEILKCMDSQLQEAMERGCQMYRQVYEAHFKSTVALYLKLLKVDAFYKEEEWDNEEVDLGPYPRKVTPCASKQAQSDHMDGRLQSIFDVKKNLDNLKSICRKEVIGHDTAQVIYVAHGLSVRLDDHELFMIAVRNALLMKESPWKIKKNDAASNEAKSSIHDLCRRMFWPGPTFKTIVNPVRRNLFGKSSDKIDFHDKRQTTMMKYVEAVYKFVRRSILENKTAQVSRHPSIQPFEKAVKDITATFRSRLSHIRDKENNNILTKIGSNVKWYRNSSSCEVAGALESADPTGKPMNYLPVIEVPGKKKGSLLYHCAMDSGDYYYIRLGGKHWSSGRDSHDNCSSVSVRCYNKNCHGRAIVDLPELMARESRGHAEMCASFCASVKEDLRAAELAKNLFRENPLISTLESVKQVIARQVRSSNQLNEGIRRFRYEERAKRDSQRVKDKEIKEKEYYHLGEEKAVHAHGINVEFESVINKWYDRAGMDNRLPVVVKVETAKGGCVPDEDNDGFLDVKDFFAVDEKHEEHLSTCRGLDDEEVSVDSTTSIGSDVEVALVGRERSEEPEEACQDTTILNQRMTRAKFSQILQTTHVDPMKDDAQVDAREPCVARKIKGGRRSSHPDQRIQSHRKGQKRRRFSESTTSESDDGYDREESPPAASKRGKQNKVHANKFLLLMDIIEIPLVEQMAAAPKDVHGVSETCYILQDSPCNLCTSHLEVLQFMRNERCFDAELMALCLDVAMAKACASRCCPCDAALTLADFVLKNRDYDSALIEHADALRKSVLNRGKKASGKVQVASGHQPYTRIHLLPKGEPDDIEILEDNWFCLDALSPEKKVTINLSKIPEGRGIFYNVLVRALFPADSSAGLTRNALEMFERKDCEFFTFREDLIFLEYEYKNHKKSQSFFPKLLKSVLQNEAKAFLQKCNDDTMEEDLIDQAETCEKCFSDDGKVVLGDFKKWLQNCNEVLTKTIVGRYMENTSLISQEFKSFELWHKEIYNKRAELWNEFFERPSVARMTCTTENSKAAVLPYVPPPPAASSDLLASSAGPSNAEHESPVITPSTLLSS